MIDKDPVEEHLGALLRGPAAPADTAFVARLERRLDAERRLEEARRAAWSRFAREASATAALLTAFMLLGRATPGAATAAAGASAPALAAALLLALWFLVELRPSAAGR
jgi:hypothetical protein